jgi:hypothetical protein
MSKEKNIIKGCAEYVDENTIMITEGPLKGMNITLNVEVLEED